MYYTIYKVTNQINGKFYIGKHQTKNLDDGYMGSGKLLKADIKKYGLENFQKEILHVFDNEKDMNAKEKELVVIGESSYNLCPGGHGGFGYINSTRDHFIHNRMISNIRDYSSLEYRQRISKIHKGIPKSSQHKKKISLSNTGPKNHFYGKKHTEETKLKMSLSRKGQIPWNKGKKSF